MSTATSTAPTSARAGAAPAPVLSSEDTQVISHRAIEDARRAAERERQQHVRPRETAHAGRAGHAYEAAHASRAGRSHEPEAASAQVTAYDGVFDVQAAQTGGVHVQPVAPAARRGGPGQLEPRAGAGAHLRAQGEGRAALHRGGIPADVFDTPEFADEAEELDDRALFARRAVSG